MAQYREASRRVCLRLRLGGTVLAVGSSTLSMAVTPIDSNDYTTGPGITGTYGLKVSLTVLNNYIKVLRCPVIS